MAGLSPVEPCEATPAQILAFQPVQVALAPLIKAMAAEAGAPLSYSIAVVLLSPSDLYGVAATFYSVAVVPEVIDGEEGEDADTAVSAYNRRTSKDIVVPRADVDVEGASHVFHETRTDVATRGLIRDLGMVSLEQPAHRPEAGASSDGTPPRWLPRPASVPWYSVEKGGCRRALALIH